jgi:hypothetical protein
MGEPRIKDNISWNRDVLRTSFELFECPDMSAQALKQKRTDDRLLLMSSSVRGGGNENQTAMPRLISSCTKFYRVYAISLNAYGRSDGAHLGVVQSQD